MKHFLLTMGFLVFFAFPVSAEPASVSFDPAQIKTQTQDIVKVDVNMFTASEPVVSTDVWITYDPAYIQPLVNDTKGGALFETVETKLIRPGVLYLYGLNKNTFKGKAAQGKLATISFKTLNPGVTELLFDCVPFKKQTTQIIKANAELTNIVSCPATVTHSATITISQSTSVLGASTKTDSILKISYGTAGIIIAIITAYLYMKYERMNKRT